MRKRKLFAGLLVVSMLLSNVTTIAYANELPQMETVVEETQADDLIAWVTNTGGMTLAERKELNLFTNTISDADYEGAKSAIIKGIQEWNEQINIAEYNISIDEISMLYNEVRFENPNLFYITGGFSYSYSPSSGVVTKLYIGYDSNFTKEDTQVYEAKVAQILKELPKNMSDTNTALWLHDYLVMHCGYDTTYSNYDPYTALVLGSTVCQGYALAYSDLLNRCGIENAYVASEPMNHAWNLVCIDGKWYHVDATWNDPLMGGEDLLGYVGHTNFLRSDTGIKQTKHHSWETTIQCNDTKYDNYYWSNIESAICFEDADTSYYFLDGILYQNEKGVTTQLSNSADDMWYVWNGNGWWTGSYNGLLLKNDNLYYNGNDTVYVYDLSEESESEYYTYNDGKGYIYGMTESVDGDEFLLEIRTSPNSAEVQRVSLEITDNDNQDDDNNQDDDTTPVTNPFTDVSESMYYYNPVLWALKNNVTAGINATEFAPEASCTRGQVVTFLWRAMGCPEPSTTTNPFVDVNSNAYYYKAVLWALENGITAGINETQFAPDQTVTRGQFVTFLHRAENKPSYSVSNPFTDVPNTYYYDAVLWAYENGVTAGINATEFAPEAFCTRGQVVTFLYRALNEE